MVLTRTSAPESPVPKMLVWRWNLASASSFLNIRWLLFIDLCSKPSRSWWGCLGLYLASTNVCTRHRHWERTGETLQGNYKGWSDHVYAQGSAQVWDGVTQD